MGRWMPLALAALLLVTAARGMTPQEAAEAQGEALELEELEELGEEYLSQGDWTQADWEGGLGDLVDRGRAAAGGVFRAALGSGALLLAVAILCGSMASLFPPLGRVDPVGLTGALAVTALAVADVNSLMGLGLEAMAQMERAAALLLPAVAAITAASGAVTGAAVGQMAAIVFSRLLLGLINGLLAPMTCAYLGVCAGGAALNSPGLRRLARTIKWAVTSVLTAVLLAFVGYLTVSGVIAGAGDAVAVKTAKFAVSSAVPVVGGILSDAAETVLGGAALLKNALGVFGMLIVLGICLLPFLELAIHYLVYRAAAALAATVADGALAGLIEGVGAAFGLLLGMTGACALLLLVSLVASLSVSVL